jgi:hypothetical protein
MYWLKFLLSKEYNQRGSPKFNLMLIAERSQPTLRDNAKLS